MRKIVPVGPYEVVEPMFEAVRLVLAQRESAYSAAYIQGISGAAFRLGGICPCAPTCALAMDTTDLLDRLNFAYVLARPGDGVDDPGEHAEGCIAAVRNEIDQGRAALVWNAFTTCEWDVVCGYDTGASAFLGRGSYAGTDDYATADMARMTSCAEICSALGAILVGDQTAPPDTTRLELDALREAVRHARDTTDAEACGDDEWRMLHGLACYDRWARELTEPGRELGMGDHYCLSVYSSTRSVAGDFLREIAPRHGGASDALLDAARCLDTETEHLSSAAAVARDVSGLGGAGLADAMGRLGESINRARDAYAMGIEDIERALQSLG